MRAGVRGGQAVAKLRGVAVAPIAAGMPSTNIGGESDLVPETRLVKRSVHETHWRGRKEERKNFAGKNKSQMPFPLLSQNALKQCTISELKKGTKGQQYAEIHFADETPVFQLSAEPLLSPFSAGVFQDDGTATRINLDLTLNEATKKILEAWDSFFADQLKNVCPGKHYHKIVQKK